MVGDWPNSCKGSCPLCSGWYVHAVGVSVPYWARSAKRPLGPIRAARLRPNPRRAGLSKFGAAESAAASEAVAPTQAERGALDQLFELFAKGRVLDVVLPRQGSDPAARLNLEAEGEPTIGSRLVGVDVTKRPGRVGVLPGVPRVLRQLRSARPRSRDQVHAQGLGERRRAQAPHCPQQEAPPARRARPRRQRPAGARAQPECSTRPEA